MASQQIQRKRSKGSIKVNGHDNKNNGEGDNRDSTDHKKRRVEDETTNAAAAPVLGRAVSMRTNGLLNADILHLGNINYN